MGERKEIHKDLPHDGSYQGDRAAEHNMSHANVKDEMDKELLRKRKYTTSEMCHKDQGMDVWMIYNIVL